MIHMPILRCLNLRANKKNYKLLFFIFHFSFLIFNLFFPILYSRTASWKKLQPLMFVDRRIILPTFQHSNIATLQHCSAPTPIILFIYGMQIGLNNRGKIGELVRNIQDALELADVRLLPCYLHRSPTPTAYDESHLL